MNCPQRKFDMDRQSVASSNIASVGYDTNSETLEIEFLKGGAVYQYYNVPDVEYDRLINADSVGKYFIANIKSAYPCEKM
jgi:hypothetical protein